MATLAASGAAVVLAACGSGAGSSSAATGASDDAAGLSFATCMRAHGVPHFPDPGGPRTSDAGISILGAHLPPTTNVRAPAFRAALSLCMRRLDAVHPPPPLSTAKKAQALRFARCMRSRGVPGFPDPVFRSDGRIGVAPGKGVDPTSPAFEHAQAACGQP
jgi:hypothetical protein